MTKIFSNYGRWSLVPRSVRKQLLLSLYSTIIITLIVTGAFFITQPEIPLYYSLPLDEQALAPKIWLFLFPVLSFVITVLHMTVVGFFQDLEPLVLKLFAWMTAFIQITFMLAVLRIVVITI